MTRCRFQRVEQPFALPSWQRAIVRSLSGWKRLAVRGVFVITAEQMERRAFVKVLYLLCCDAMVKRWRD